MSETVLRSDNITKKYKGSSQYALNGFSLKIDRQDFFGLLGPNGAGKTTAISILTGLLKATSGSTTILGEAQGWNNKSAKGHLGIVPQNIALYPTLSVMDNILYFGKLHGMSGKPLKAAAERVLDQVGLYENKDKVVKKCSGGMQRRANLAAGYIHTPEILFLDEPTVGVDPQSRKRVFETIRELNNSGMTIIYTTHYMEEAEQLCSRISIMDEGKVIEHGTPKSLLEKYNNCENIEEIFITLTGKHLRD